MPTSRSPIGVFDSGLGGLTVARAIRTRFPDEHLVYLGDTARVPYGTRSAGTVMTYARACARHLVHHDIKLLVVACNTVSAVALPMLALELDLPVLGVITAGARAGVHASAGGKIGVMATAGTVASGAYTRALSGLDSRVETHMVAAPLLVPLAEEGWTEGEVPELVAQRYLRPLVGRQIDALVLGCTHYPVLRAVIESQLHLLTEWDLPVVDSASAAADDLEEILTRRGLRAEPGAGGGLDLLVTDRPACFLDVARRFLGGSLSPNQVTQVDL